MVQLLTAEFNGFLGNYSAVPGGIQFQQGFVPQVYLK